MATLDSTFHVRFKFDEKKLASVRRKLRLIDKLMRQIKATDIKCTLLSDKEVKSKRKK